MILSHPRFYKVDVSSNGEMSACTQVCLLLYSVLLLLYYMHVFCHAGCSHKC